MQVVELEAMRKREEGKLKALQKEHQQLKKEQFKAAQALHALRQVRGCQSQSRRNVCLVNLAVQDCLMLHGPNSMHNEQQDPPCLPRAMLCAPRHKPWAHNIVCKPAPSLCSSCALLRTQAEKELISDIAGGQGQAKNLTARQKALDEQLQRQGELMYAVDFSLQVGLRASQPPCLQQRQLQPRLGRARMWPVLTRR
jgi:hypothetical protein